jgi:hypothetical protein
MTVRSGRCGPGSIPGPASDASPSGCTARANDLQLAHEKRGWRATFYTTGMEHSPTSATGTAWEGTPWHATQRAAWAALRRAEENNSKWPSTVRGEYEVIGRVLDQRGQLLRAALGFAGCSSAQIEVRQLGPEKFSTMRTLLHR